MANKNKWTAPLRERDITRQIAREYFQEFDRLIESDVIVVGAGPSGLLCARDLASFGFKTLLIEQALFLGGGFWSGGYLMNKATICAPADKILDELHIPAKRIKECEGMFMVDPPHATAKLIAAAYDAGVKVLNLTKVIDLILRRENVLEGVVVNWSPVEHAGHDAAVVTLLNRRGLHKAVPGNGAMWVERSEELVVANTREVYPNCFLAGLSVSAVDASPRMGPAFGAMLLSGRRAAELVRKKLKQE